MAGCWKGRVLQARHFWKVLLHPTTFRSGFSRVPGRLLGLFLWIVWLPAWGHSSSDSHLTLQVGSGRIDVVWQVALRDLDLVVGLDDDGDGRINDAELERHRVEAARHVAGKLAVRVDGVVAGLRGVGNSLVERLDGPYLEFRFVMDGVGDPSVLEVDYRLFEGLDPHHRGLMTVRHAGTEQLTIFDRSIPTQSFDVADPAPARAFLRYALKGVWHIWAGVDHLLFLSVLLLPAVGHWERSGAGWRPVNRLGEALVTVVKVVTAFTLAHSITLGVAVMGWFSPPSRWIETSIALSVLVAAANNLRPLVPERGWGLALGFGFLHGFGFAGGLMESGLLRVNRVLALAGFNVGVEAGQLAVVALVIPVLHGMRRWNGYRRWILGLGSALIGVLACFWVVERWFGVKWLPF